MQEQTGLEVPSGQRQATSLLRGVRSECQLLHGRYEHEQARRSGRLASSHTVAVTISVQGRTVALQLGWNILLVTEYSVQMKSVNTFVFGDENSIFRTAAIVATGRRHSIRCLTALRKHVAQKF